MVDVINVDFKIGDAVMLKDLENYKTGPMSGADLIATIKQEELSIFIIVEQTLKFPFNRETLDIEPNIVHTVVPFESLQEYMYTRNQGRYRRLLLQMSDEFLILINKDDYNLKRSAVHDEAIKNVAEVEHELA